MLRISLLDQNSFEQLLDCYPTRDKYIDWVGNIYKRRVKVIEKRWRGFLYWDPYTSKQIKSCLELVEYLCKKYDIPHKCVGHNTYISGIEFFEGIAYRSNYNKEMTDLSPAWDFENLKNKPADRCIGENK